MMTVNQSMACTLSMSSRPWRTVCCRHSLEGAQSQHRSGGKNSRWAYTPFTLRVLVHPDIQQALNTCLFD